MLEIRKALSNMLIWGVTNYDNLNKLTINIDMMDNDGYTRRAIMKLGDWVMKVSGNLLMKTIGEHVFDQEEFYANVTAPCRIYKEGKDGLLEVIFPWFDENVDTWGAKPLISYNPENKQWSTHPNDNDVLPENRYNVRLVQATLADVVGSISGELAKQHISECNEEEVVDPEKPVDTEAEKAIERAKIVHGVLEREYYEFVTNDDNYNCIYESYNISTDEFDGTALQWFNWICRSSLTVDGDDHLCQKTLDRLAAPVIITGKDDKLYWPAILCGGTEQPLIMFGKECYVMNPNIDVVDVDNKNEIKIIQNTAWHIANRIIGASNQ